MQTMNTIEASTTPANERWPRFHRRYHAHNPDTGRNDSNAELVSAATPQSAPNSSHGLSPSFSSMVRVSQKIIVSNRAARLVSHTQRVHQYMTDGNRAQVQDVHTATFSLKHRFAIRKIGIQVRAEKM